MKKMALAVTLLIFFLSIPSCTLFLNSDEDVFVGTWETDSGSVWEFKASGSFLINSYTAGARWKVNSDDELEISTTLFAVLFYGESQMETIVINYEILNNDEIQLYDDDGSLGSLLTRIE